MMSRTQRLRSSTWKRMLASAFVTGLTATALVGCGSSSSASSFPSKSITFIVPYKPGGATDIIARTIDKQTKSVFGHHFTFKYAPGASGTLGLKKLTSAKANGYTIAGYNFPNIDMDDLVGAGGVKIGNFSYIAQLAADPQILVTPKGSKIRSLKAFIAAAKANPGKVSVAIPSQFDGTEVALWELEAKAHIKVNLIPYQGGAQEKAAILGKKVEAAMVNYGNVPAIKSDLNLLAVSTAKAFKLLPSTPTFKSFGYNIVTHDGRIIIGPTGIKQPILKQLQAGFKKIYDNKQFKSDMAKIHEPVSYMSGSQLKKYVQNNYSTFRKLLKQFDPKALSH